jgi:hypothetical protein
MAALNLKDIALILKSNSPVLYCRANLKVTVKPVE